MRWLTRTPVASRMREFAAGLQAALALGAVATRAAAGRLLDSALTPWGGTLAQPFLVTGVRQASDPR